MKSIYFLVVMMMMLMNVAQAASQDPLEKITVVIKQSSKRNPSSSCFSSDRVNALDALLIADYRKCSSDEVAAVKKVMQRGLEFQINSFRTSDTFGRSSAMTYIAASRSTLALLTASGL